MHTTTAKQTAALPGPGGDRVRILIERFAALTEPGKGPGATRLAYNPLERRARAEFTAYIEELGLQVRTDAAGNTIPELPGSGPRLPALGTGSHLDSPGLMDGDGVSVADAMRAINIDPEGISDAVWDENDCTGFIVLHIEQGSVLTEAGLPVGMVGLISGSTRIRIDITGRASHTGGTPMHLRVDALAASAQIVLAAEELAKDSRHHGTRITVGKLVVHAGSITTIPGHCQLHVDVRDVDNDRQRFSTSELIAAAHEIAADRGVGISVEVLADASPVVLPVTIRNAITASAAGSDWSAGSCLPGPAMIPR